MKRVWVSLLGAAASGFIAAPEARAWGDAGHRIVCQLAYLELTPAAKAKADALIALDPKFKSFAASCTWPDIFPVARPAEHFMNVPRGARAVEAANLCPAAERCVAKAILNDTQELATNTDAGERLRLLKSLGHWVGDIHQPFHVSFEDDKGGNYIAASGGCASSLHLVWDFCIVESAIGTDEEEIAAALRSEISAADRKAWAPASLDASAVAAWATESLEIVTRSSVQYCFQHNGECWYSPEAQQLNGTRRTVEITGHYLDEEAPIVRDRLKRAAIRLAAILNAVFSN
jgi:S1/P1 Nuclease